MRKRTIALILGALAVGLIAGCGGSDSSDSGGEISTSSLTKAEFTKQAIAICTKQHNKVGAELGAYLKKHGAPKESERGRAFAALGEAVVFPAYKIEAKELRALGAPSGSEEEVEAILTAFDRGIKEAEKNASKGEGITPPGMYKANELAKKFGLTTCVTT